MGDKAANLKRSTARATSVAAWLTGKGIDVARVTTAGLGENTTDDGRVRNRRVVLIKQ